MIEIRRVEAPEYLATLGESALEAGPFACPAAVEVWLDHHGGGREFAGIIGTEGAGTVGALPLCAAFAGRVLRPVGAGVATELTVAAAPGRLREFMTAVRAFLSRSPALALDLPDVREGGDLWAALEPLPRKGLPSHECPYIEIGGDWTARLSKKRRHEARRTAARLGGFGEVAHLVVDDARVDELPSRLAECVEVHAARTAGRMNSSGFSRSERPGFYPDLFARLVPERRALLSCLLLDGRVVSFFAGVAHGRRFTAMLTAFDERYAAAAPGHVNIHHLLRELNARGIEVCDFSKGRSEYKSRWARESYQLHHVVVHLRESRIVREGVARLLTLRDKGRELGLNERARAVIERLT